MIRTASLGDLESIVKMEQTFGAEAFSRRSLRHFLLSKNIVLVAIDPIMKTRIAYAIILLRSDTTKARLYSITVTEEARGKGLGKLMMDAVEHHVRNSGRTAITLEVRTNNLVAQKLYRNSGFHYMKRLNSYYGEHIDGYRMKKELTL